MQEFMKGVDPALVTIAFGVSLAFGAYQWFTSSEKEGGGKSGSKMASFKAVAESKRMNFKRLEAHTDEFRKAKIISVVDNRIHVAIGFGLANCILIEGEKGCVMIDAMESNESARDVLEAFDSITDKKPVEAIILTHFHADHTHGLGPIQKKFPGAKVFAHDTLSYYFQQLLNVRSQITHKRAAFQFGNYLDEEEHENSGIGIRLR